MDLTSKGDVVKEATFIVEVNQEELSQLIQLVEGSRNYVKKDLLNKLYFAEIVE